MLIFYRDAAALAAAREEKLKPAGYEATFDCIACTLVTNGEPPEVMIMVTSNVSILQSSPPHTTHPTRQTRPSQRILR